MARGLNGAAPKKGKKNRKHGRNKVYCHRYEVEDRRDKNKVKRRIRHLKKHPNDKG